jgi:uncharacterized protein (DUF1778 family)
MKTNKKKTKTEQVSFRLTRDLRRFYEERAEAERRRLSETLRLALEDHAKTLQEQAAA